MTDECTCVYCAYERATEVDPHCPACAGKSEGEWMDLCDDHLAAWVQPALDEGGPL